MSSGVTLEAHTGQPTSVELDEWAEYLASAVRRGFFGDLGVGESADDWTALMRQWWTTNPYVDDTTTVALLVRSDGRVVGFHGLIPVEYSLNGDPLPTLMATTFVVDPEFRGHSMKVFRRVAKLGARNQIVDGSATEDMRTVLDAAGWSFVAGEVSRSVVVRPRGPVARLRSIALIAARWAVRPDAVSLPPGTRWVTDARHHDDPLPTADDVVRPPTERRFVEWIMSNGAHPRVYVGLADSEGRRLAYAVLEHRMRSFGTCVVRAVDGAGTEGSVSLSALLMAAAANPEAAGLPAGAAVVRWSELDGSDDDDDVDDGAASDSRRVYYRLPGALTDRRREARATESDDVWF
ncbi:MAG: hypothetical protein AAGF91_14250 [Actinomycetota bacterium]